MHMPCLLNFSIWMFNRHLNFSEAKTKLFNFMYPYLAFAASFHGKAQDNASLLLLGEKSWHYPLHFLCTLYPSNPSTKLNQNRDIA